MAVSLHFSGSASIGDPDMREYQRELALSGIAKRQAVFNSKGRPKASARVTTPRPRRKSQPLFIPDADDQAHAESDEDIEWEEIEDAEMAVATQASLAALEEQEADDLRRAVLASKEFSSPKTPKTTPPKTPNQSRRLLHSSSDSENDLYAPTPSRLATQLKFANTDHKDGVEGPTNALFSNPTLLLPSEPSPPADTGDSDDDLEEVPVPTKLSIPAELVLHSKVLAYDENPSLLAHAEEKLPKTSDLKLIDYPDVNLPSAPAKFIVDSEEELEKAQVELPKSVTVHFAESTPERSTGSQAIPPRPTPTSSILEPRSRLDQKAVVQHSQESTETPKQSTPQPSRNLSPETVPVSVDGLLTIDSDSEDEGETWSRPASPALEKSATEVAAEREEHWDAAHEMRPHEEETEFAQFVSQVKGKDLDSVRREIDDEIRQLNQQKKTAMRDSEDVTQAMVTQIMVRLFIFSLL